VHSPPELNRLSLNQITTDKRDLRETVDACVRAGIEWIGLWRHKIGPDAAQSARLVKDAGLRVSSLCRGGFFPAATAAERRIRIEDNLRAIDEAATSGTDLLVLVAGPAPDRDIEGARRMVAEGIAEIAPRARECGVRLGIEPLHPAFASDRSVIVTLEQANNIVTMFPGDQVGVVVDVYHVWWDPNVYREIARAGRRIFGFHVSDWITPMANVLLGRGLMGRGVIDIAHLRCAVEGAGYAGPIEVEIFNQEVWKTDLDDVMRQIKECYLEAV
jgi:sugar phosphate isomerase/epimerase